jgi:predicted GNAT superfamily acetyltransferase
MTIDPMQWHLLILDKSEELTQIENLQRKIWPSSETDVIPAHMLQAAVHNGGLVIAAYPNLDAPDREPNSAKNEPIGFVYGFPGFYLTPDGPRLKHCSHMLGVDPAFRNQGLGFALKRAQWQMVRKQGIDRITWTYDPLLSPNAYLNIARLGAVCNTYYPDYYGAMRDSLNVGLPSDRFQVDWWVNSRRVNHRLSSKPRPALHLDQFSSAEVLIVNQASIDESGLPHPPKVQYSPSTNPDSLVMIEIPSDFQTLKKSDPGLALEWRLHSRLLFASLFNMGYLVTDFVHEPFETPHSYYILTYSESTF